MQTQVSSARPPRIGYASVCLFLALSWFYLLFARGRATSVDELHVYATAESLAERGSWRMELEGVKRPYSRYSVVPSLFGAPFCKLAIPIADRLAPELPSSNLAEARRELKIAAASFQTPFVTAGTAALLLFGLCRLGFRPGSALGAAMVFAVGTLAFPYSGSLYVQPVAALAVTCAVLTVALEVDVLMAFSLVFLFAIRFELVLIVPIAALHILKCRQPVGRGLGWLVAGTLGGVGVHVLVNSLRLDHWFVGDYGGEAFSTPLGLGLWSVLFSSGKGLVWFVPAAALGLILLPLCVRQVPRYGMVVTGIVVTMMLMVSCWWTWHGAWSWGPRLLVPMMPLLAVPFACLFEQWEQRTAAQRWLTVFVLAVSVAIQFRGVLANPLADRETLGPLVNENESIYIPQVGPWGAATDGSIDVFLCRMCRAVPAWRLSLIVVAAVFLLLSCSFGLATLRCLEMRLGDLNQIFPRTEPRELFVVAAFLILLSAPTVLEWWLLPPANPQEANSQTLGKQFRAFDRAGGGSHWAGRIYVPLQGDYLFFQVGPPFTRFQLNGVPLFGPPTSQVAVGSANELIVGFHSLELETVSGGSTSRLYWTTPGNAHFKELVPNIYLTKRDPDWRDRGVIMLSHWKWLGWAMVIVLFVFRRRDGALEYSPKESRAPIHRIGSP